MLAKANQFAACHDASPSCDCDPNAFDGEALMPTLAEDAMKMKRNDAKRRPRQVQPFSTVADPSASG